MRATGSALPLASKRSVERVSSQPAINAPRIIVALIALFAIIHGVKEYVLDDDAYGFLLQTFAFVPARLSLTIDPDGLADALGALNNARDLAVAKFFLADGSLAWWAVITYAFLHADWTHVIFNSVWLLAFGAPVARRFGDLRFAAFFVITSALGILFHYALHRYDFTPVVGASAGVSALTAAALRFVFQPFAPLGDHADDAPSFHQPALPLTQLFTNGRVVAFLGIWFLANFIFGAFSQGLGMTQGPVAWEAHAGGFVAGLLLFGWFDRVQRHN